MGVIVGSGKDDVLSGTASGDTIFGSGGNDAITGGVSNDVLYGDGSGYRNADLDRLVVTEATTAVITFGDASAGYKNAVGMYRIAADGTISGVEILTNPNTNNGKGGNNKPLEVAVGAGEKLGFFVVPDGYSQKGKGMNLMTAKNGHFELRDANGDAATASSKGAVRLWHVSDNGKAEAVNSAYGKDIFHSFGGGRFNSDGLVHAKGTIDLAKGQIQLGFEDLKGGGDADFNDAIINIAVGQVNAGLMPGLAGAVSTKKSQDDVIKAGAGNDVIFAMSGNDKVQGEAGNDKVWGSRGNDSLDGGAGVDQLNGGSGDDELSGGDGNDKADGGSGHDMVDGGAGDDWLNGGSGNDHVVGGAGDDRLLGGSGNDTLDGGAGDDVAEGGSGNDWIVAGAGSDRYVGGSGSDTLDGSALSGGMKLDMSKKSLGGGSRIDGIENVVGSDAADWIRGDKRDNAIDGGDGRDWIRGAEGADVLTGGDGADDFVFLKKDVASSGGKSLGMDTILDFSVKEGDQLLLHDLVKGVAKADADQVLSVDDTKAGLVISAEIDGRSFDVVLLEDVHGLSLKELIADGAIVL